MDLKALHKISYGIYIICSKNNEKINGQIANSIFQVSSDPPTIAVSINKKNLTHDCIQKCKLFTISILSEDTPMNFIGNFGFKSGRDCDKFKDIEYKLSENKIPIILDNATAYIELSLIDSIDVSTHTIFIGKVIDANILTDKPVMTYEYYHVCKGGSSPKNAPTYYKKIDDEIKKKEEIQMDRYVCVVCGYVYDPAKGDPDNGINPGTKFEDLPKEWVCPICGASKEEFEKE